MVSSVACFGSGHKAIFFFGAIYNSQLATLDVEFRKLCASMVGPPPKVDWSAAWNGALHLWHERVKKLYFKCTRQYMDLNHMQKPMEFPKSCCRFTCSSVGSTFAVVASIWYSSLGPSMAYVGINTSGVLEIRISWIVEGSGSG